MIERRILASGPGSGRRPVAGSAESTCPKGGRLVAGRAALAFVAHGVLAVGVRRYMQRTRNEMEASCVPIAADVTLFRPGEVRREYRLLRTRRRWTTTWHGQRVALTASGTHGSYLPRKIGRREPIEIEGQDARLERSRHSVSACCAGGVAHPICGEVGASGRCGQWMAILVRFWPTRGPKQGADLVPRRSSCQGRQSPDHLRCVFRRS